MKPNLKFLVVLAALLFMASPAIVLAQTSPAAPRQKPAASTAPFDPHDLSGFWDPTAQGRSTGESIYGSISKDVPPRTPWGQAQYDAAKPSYGPKGQTNGNDPIYSCTPTGIPRILFFPQPIQIMQNNGVTLQFFEREHAYRQIYTDGRAHPPDLDPTWMGHSIGKWDGDTFVVDSVGFNDKAWIDFFGNPRSEKLHLTERWKRLDHDTLTLQLIAEDPGAYTKTWVGDTKYFRLLPPKLAFMDELFCIPDEENAFRDRIRFHASHEGVPDTNKK